MLALLRYRDVERTMIVEFHWRTLKHDYLHFALLFGRPSGSSGGTSCVGVMMGSITVYRSTVIGSNQMVD